ncbi:hypothetical protein M569_11143, partial [Genlisea aurea]
MVNRVGSQFASKANPPMAATCSFYSVLSAQNLAARFRIAIPFSVQKSWHAKKEKADRFSRREFLNGALALLPAPLVSPPSSAREVEVGTYLPPSPDDRAFVVFTASPKDTPALRAGNVEPYKFILPPTWKQMRVANILSGNYCQPKCAEPWVEVKFEDERQGRIQVVASPLIRLTNKPNATIEEIGSPEKVIASLGPFVTGNTFDPDELLQSSVEKRRGQT